MHCALNMLTWITGHSPRARLMFFVNLHTFASTVFVFMHSIAIKFLGFLEENIKYFSICPHQTLMRYEMYYNTTLKTILMRTDREFTRLKQQ